MFIPTELELTLVSTDEHGVFLYVDRDGSFWQNSGDDIRIIPCSLGPYLRLRSTR